MMPTMTIFNSAGDLVMSVVAPSKVEPDKEMLIEMGRQSTLTDADVVKVYHDAIRETLTQKFGEEDATDIINHCKGRLVQYALEARISVEELMALADSHLLPPTLPAPNREI